MSKMTRNDLQEKTTAQLTALFSEAVKNLGCAPVSSHLRPRIMSHLAMIRAELARRGPSP